jgi:hypothetical protein
VDCRKCEPNPIFAPAERTKNCSIVCPDAFEVIILPASILGSPSNILVVFILIDGSMSLVAVAIAVLLVVSAHLIQVQRSV